MTDKTVVEIANIGLKNDKRIFIICHDDMIIGNRLKNMKMWEPMTTYFLWGLGQKWKNFAFLDLGAHVGYFSVVMAELFDNCNIYAIEANPYNYEILKQNLECYDNIKSFGCAVDTEEKECNFYYGEVESGGGTLDRSTIEADYEITTIKVQTKKLCNFDIDFDKVRIVKIDTQGNEIDILVDSFDLFQLGTYFILENQLDLVNILESKLAVDAVCFSDNNIIFKKR